MIVKLRNVRLSYADLFVAKDFEGDQNFKYKAHFIIAPASDADKAMRDAIAQITKEAWKDKAALMLKSIENNEQKFCFRNGDLRKEEEYHDHMFVSASSKVAPTVVDRNNTVKLTQADGRPYSSDELELLSRVDTELQRMTSPAAPP